MPIEIRLLAFSVLLGLVHVIAAAMAAMPQRPGGLAWAAGSRDAPPPPVVGLAARLERASKNFLETFPFFAAAVLAAAAMDRHNSWVVYGAHCYFWGRLAYLPLYATGTPWVRSLAWGAAVIGIVLVVIGLFVRG
jgi:uncharacterized MAPEG superfamily protein